MRLIFALTIFVFFLSPQCAVGDEAAIKHLTDAQSFKLLSIMAERGNPDAENKLGLMYERGVGTQRSCAKTLKWLHKSAAHWASPANYSLSSLYENGMCVPKDTPKAAALAYAAAVQGFVPAEVHLGYLYANGIGIKKDIDNAYFWDLLASKSGWNFFFGVREVPPGADLPLVSKQRAEIERRVSEWTKTHPLPTRPVFHPSPKTSIEILAVLEKEGKLATSEQQYEAGMQAAYSRGYTTPPAEQAAGIAWVRKAADAGYLPAEIAMGHANYWGVGVPIDCRRSIKYWRMAADRNDPWAQIDLAWAYLTGDGTKKDYKEAYFWYRLGTRPHNGDQKPPEIISQTKDSLDEAKRHLTKSEISAVGRRVELWMAQ